MMTNTLKTTTPSGTPIMLTATECNGMATISVDLPGQPGIRITEGNLQGIHCLVGEAVRNGKRVPLGIQVTPEIRHWLDGIASERKAAASARAEVHYLDHNTWEPSTWTVDLRLTDDDIIANLPASVLAAATGTGFREALVAVRAGRNAQTQAAAAYGAKIQAAREEAQRTGKPVEIARILVDCEGPEEDCSTDLRVTRVYPDGSIQEERIHTF